MRFLFIAPRYHTNQHFIIKTLLSKGHQVRFLVSVRGQSEDYSILKPEVMAVSILSRLLNAFFFRNKDPFFYSRFNVPSLFAFLRLLYQYHPHVIIIRNPDFLPSFFSLVLAILLRKNIIIYTQHAKYRENISFTVRLLHWLLLDILKYAWITPVYGVKTSRTVSHPKVYYLPFIYESRSTGYGPSQDKDMIGIVSVGKFEPRKNHLLLLEAIKNISGKYPIHLTLIGECSKAVHELQLGKIKNFIEKNNLYGIVTLLTNISFAEVQKEYVKNHLFVLPSTREPAAVSILEAMAHGLAVICSDSNGTKCYIEEGVNGFVFKDNNSQDLEEKIIQAISDRERLECLGKNSLQIVEKYHSPSRYYTNLMEIIRKHFGFGEKA